MDDSPLLRLPPELRNWIYELVVVEKDAIRIENTSVRALPPGLTHTCRQLRVEASPIHYGQNIFVIHPWMGFRMAYLPGEEDTDFFQRFLKAWLVSIGSDNRLLLHRVYLDDDFYELSEVDERITRCTAALRREGIAIDSAVIFVELFRNEEGEREWVSSG